MLRANQLRTYEFGSVGLDADGLNLDTHLIVLVVGLRALVLLVVVSVASAVIHDGDHRRPARLVHASRSRGRAEEGSSYGGGGTGLHDLTATSLHGHHGGEGGSRAGKSENSDRAEHFFFCFQWDVEVALRCHRSTASREKPETKIHVCFYFPFLVNRGYFMREPLTTLTTTFWKCF